MFVVPIFVKQFASLLKLRFNQVMRDGRG